MYLILDSTCDSRSCGGRAACPRGANPGTVTLFPANGAGNRVAVPGLRSGFANRAPRFRDSMEFMRSNTTRERLAKGEVVYGCGLQVYRAPEIPRAFAAAGFDYVFIDLERGSARK